MTGTCAGGLFDQLSSVTNIISADENGNASRIHCTRSTDFQSAKQTAGFCKLEGLEKQGAFRGHKPMEPSYNAPDLEGRNHQLSRRRQTVP